MIDFRYHLVSLAAVLIALSIGIVLGAGPLNDNIGSTLSGEVTKLRQDKEQLRAENADQRRQIEGRDAYDEQTLQAVVSGELTDRRVTVVSLPEAVDDDVDAVRTTLERAGASVGPSVEVSADWARDDDAATSERTEVGEAALDDLGVEPAVPDGAQQIDQALATVLTATDQRGSGTVTDADRDKAWTRLTEADLVDGPDDTPRAADLVVVIGGPVPATDAAEGDTVDRAAERTAGAWVALAHLIEVRADGTVLASAEASTGTGDASPVTMARTRGSMAEGVSTVDVPAVPMGRAAIVLALVEQREGASGHYGLGQSVDGPLPATS